MVPTMEITLGAMKPGTWICTCRSIPKTKPSRDVPSIGVSAERRLCAAEVSFALPVRGGSFQIPRRQKRRRRDPAREPLARRGTAGRHVHGRTATNDAVASG